MVIKRLFVIASLFIFINTAVFAVEKPTESSAAAQIVACVGDSITFGAGIKNRNQNSYPAQLQKILGDEFKVINFGFSARTLLKKGDHPYWNEKMYQRALASNPSYVIIKLGSNDVKPKNWQYKDEFKSDLKEFAESFVNLPSRPKVFLSYPVPVQIDKWGINEKSITNGVIPFVKAVAEELNLSIIDFHSAVPAEKKYFVDGVHPNVAGARIMAGVAYESIMDKPYWTEMFNGKDLAGWHNPYQRGKAAIVDGEIHLTSPGGKWFFATEKTFKDFIFEAEVKMPDDEGYSNSGFMFRCHVAPNKVYGYQAEVDTQARRWSGGLYDEGRRSWVHPQKKNYKPSVELKQNLSPEWGEDKLNALKRHDWNKYRIECRGDEIKIFVNGVLTTHLIDSTDAEGHIALQHHGEKGKLYRFRNVRIHEILK